MSRGAFWNQGPNSAPYSHTLRSGCASCIRYGMRPLHNLCDLCELPGWGINGLWYSVTRWRQRDGATWKAPGWAVWAKKRAGTGGRGKQGCDWASHSPGTMLTWDLAELNPGTAAWSLGFSSWGGAGPWGAGPVEGGDKSPEWDTMAFRREPFVGDPDPNSSYVC